MKMDDLGRLDELLEKAQKLREFLEESPEIMAFAKSLQDSRDPVLLMQQDRLVRASETASILGVNPNTIGKYVKEGRLKAWYTPGSSQRKYRLSEIWGIPQESTP